MTGVPHGLRSITVSETPVLAELCRRSLSRFVREFWPILDSTALKWNWHMDVFCDEVQVVIERVLNDQDKEYDLLVNVPPGTSKSTIITVMAPAWAWTRNRAFRTIATSHAKDLALYHGRRSRLVVESEKYKRLFPEVGEMREDQNVKGHFENINGGMRMSTGMRGSIGYHGHLIIIDDPLDPLASRGEKELEEASEWIQGTLSTRKIDKTKTPTIMVMQRLHVEDPAAKMLEASSASAPVRHIQLPGEILTEGAEVKPSYLRHNYVDGLMDPQRLSMKALDELGAKLGHFGYQAQVLQNPGLKGSGMFDVSRVRFGKMPPMSEFRRIVRFWDNAATEGGDGAKTAGAKIGKHVSGQFWILDMLSGAWETYTRERMKVSTAHTDGHSVEIGLEQEPGSGGKDQAIMSIANLAGFMVSRDRPIGDKTTRADPLAYQVNGGNVWVPEGAPWWPALKAQMAAFPASKLRDQIDALSGSFSRLTKGIRLGAPGQRK